MIETPASALEIDKFIALSDFISIGTNDLIQYVMAASRENPDVADYYEKGIDYILPLVKNIAKACKKAGKECCVCGEIVNDEHCLKKFIHCGIEQFSISAFRIPHLKAYIRHVE
jgi:phosphotransferase system enzyme I (PtsI)